MRKGIDYVGVGVGAIIVSGEGKYFLAKRGRRAKNERGKWEFPGGSLEFGETMRGALIREIQEEFGIEIDPFELLPAYDHIIPDENQHWIALAFLSKIKSGEPKILEPAKCEAIGWFSISEIENMDLAISSRYHLKKIPERREKSPLDRREK